MKPDALIVDDNAINRAVLQAMLGDAAAVRFACDGAEALSCVEERTPDIVFLDIMMPQLDGLGVLRALLERDRRDVVARTLVVSAKADEETMAEVAALGARGFVAKPVSLPVIKDYFAAIVQGGEMPDQGRLAG